ncbi:3'-5' exonuclease [Melaminivora sp.]
MPRRQPPSKEQSALLPPYPGLPATRIHVPDSAQAFAAASAALLAAPVLGFDTESRPSFTAGAPLRGPDLVQLATTGQAWLLQLQHPEALDIARQVLAAPGILKVGFGLDNDKRSLPLRLGVEPVSLLDLDQVFARHGFGRNTGVRAAMALVLGQQLSKSKKASTSNWATTRLSPSQIHYAATDAHAPALLWQALPAWESAQPATVATGRRPRPHLQR